MRPGQTTLVFDECLVYVCQHISQIYSSCTVVCREAGNERWQNVITPAAAGSFYFRLPSGKDTTHLPVVKTQPPHSQSPGWCEQKPHDEIYYMRSPAVDTRRRPAGGSQFFIGVNTPILFFLMILVRVLRTHKESLDVGGTASSVTDIRRHLLSYTPKTIVARRR